MYMLIFNHVDHGLGDPQRSATLSVADSEEIGSLGRALGIHTQAKPGQVSDVSLDSWSWETPATLSVNGLGGLG